MNWFANIVQNLSVKNGTLPIIHGAQGSGKSCFAELMCELLGHLAIYNNDDLDKVFGKFNSISDGKVLIVLNETEHKRVTDEQYTFQLITRRSAIEITLRDCIKTSNRRSKASIMPSIWECFCIIC